MNQNPNQYPNSDIYERAYLVKLFHNTKLHKHLEYIQPSIFLDKKRRFIAFLLKHLYERKQSLTVDNLTLIQNLPDERIITFMKRNGIVRMSEAEIHDVLFDVTVDSRDKFFEQAEKEVLKLTFNRFVTDAVESIKYYNGYNNQHAVLSKTKAIGKVHDILYSTNGKANNDNHIQSAIDLINDDNEYIPTSSSRLNGYIGGFTRGYVNTIFAKSGHCKSSWTDYNILQNIATGKITGKIYKITPEESAATQYKRMIAMLCKVSTSAMLQKRIKATQEHFDVVKDALKDKLVIYEKIFRYDAIVDIMHSLKDADMIYIDHINKIDYPGNGTWLNNMIGGIPGMVNVASRIAQKVNIFGLYPTVILLSQVADKEIQRSDRLIKAPHYYDCYGSSALYQASRQMIGFWYPVKDYEDNPMGFMGRETPTINDMQLGIEKSSYSVTNKFPLKYDPEFNLFYDVTAHTKKDDYEPPQEKGLFDK